MDPGFPPKADDLTDDSPNDGLKAVYQVDKIYSAYNHNHPTLVERLEALDKGMTMARRREEHDDEEENKKTK